MIVLDTHTWIWWVHGHASLPQTHSKLIEENERIGLGVCAISCWEVAKLVEKKRLELPLPVTDWMGLALGYPGITLLALDPRIAIESTRLPGTFHNDPADQIIVATARLMECPLLTSDQKILDYPYVVTPD